jgi:hypothetical protein
LTGLDLVHGFPIDDDLPGRDRLEAEKGADEF